MTNEELGAGLVAALRASGATKTDLWAQVADYLGHARVMRPEHEEKAGADRVVSFLAAAVRAMGEAARPGPVPVRGTLNINDQVRVTLTKAGADYLNGVNGTRHPRHQRPAYFAGHTRTFQLWELMHELGPQTGMLMEQLIVDNVIEVVP